jgi:trimethylamine:corrinoid methyltransferase-like protein
MKTSLLSQEQVERIHEASLRILAEVGVAIPHPGEIDAIVAAARRGDRLE